MRYTDMMDMLNFITQRGLKWMINTDLVVIPEDGGYGIYEGWSLKDKGECIAFAFTKKDVIAEVKTMIWGEM